MKLSHLSLIAFILIGSAVSVACGATPENADVSNVDESAEPEQLTAEQQAEIEADTAAYSDAAAESAADEAAPNGAPSDAGHLEVQATCRPRCYIDYRVLYADRGGQIRYKRSHQYVRGCTQITRCARG